MKTKRTPCDNGIKIGVIAAANKEITRIFSYHQKVGEPRKISSQKTEGACLCQHLDFGAATLHWERVNFCCLKPPSLLQSAIASLENEYTVIRHER